MTEQPCPGAPEKKRRDFVKEILAAGLGGLVGFVPLAAGVTVFLDPLRRRAGSTGAVWVTNLEALPNDGLPRKFPVLATRVDAWNRTSQVPIGAVYLRRLAEGKIEALNVVCPHLGCFVDYLPDKNKYLCPCHNSSFTVAGQIADRASPAPRGLDSLQVEVREGKEVWVKFENFQSGRPDKVPVA